MKVNGQSSNVLQNNTLLSNCEYFCKSLYNNFLLPDCQKWVSEWMPFRACSKSLLSASVRAMCNTGSLDQRQCIIHKLLGEWTPSQGLERLQTTVTILCTTVHTKRTNPPLHSVFDWPTWLDLCLRGASWPQRATVPLSSGSLVMQPMTTQWCSWLNQVKIKVETDLTESVPSQFDSWHAIDG